MTKYIKKRKRGERIEHQFFYGNEYKTCSCCNEWKLLDQFAKKGNGKQSSCKSCAKKYDKQRHKLIKEQLEKAREGAPTGFSVCVDKSCKKGVQPVDQFIGAHVRNDEATDICKTCRNKVMEAQKRRYAACKKVWDDWRKTHPCVICSQNLKYEHNPLLIEADHLPEFKKVARCSSMKYWCHSKRGPAAQKAELKKCQALCRFHHALQTQQRNHDNGKIEKSACKLRKRAIINAEKNKRECCLRCKRVVKEGEECGVDFDHRDASTKFKYKGKAMNPTNFVDLPDAIFDKQWPLEQAKCDLLCANCHTLKNNRDGYRK